MQEGQGRRRPCHWTIPVGLTRIVSLKTKHVIQQIRLYYTGRVQILDGGSGGGMCLVVSAGKENIFFKSRCKNLLFNFESFLTLKGSGFSDVGTARRESGICLHL